MIDSKIKKICRMYKDVLFILKSFFIKCGIKKLIIGISKQKNDKNNHWFISMFLS